MEIAPFKTYKRRWYILAVFAGLTLHQSWLYCTYGPITTALKFAYPKWTSPIVAMTANAGTASYLVFTWPCCYVMQELGTRKASILITAMVTAGAAARSLVTSSTGFTAATFVCMVLNGFAGVLSAAGTPLIASLWFKDTERITATSIILAANMMGVGVANVAGPMWLSNGLNFDAYDENRNGTEDDGSDFSPQEMRGQIAWYTMWQTVVLALLLVSMLVYFPSKPEIPPTSSSDSARLNLKDGMAYLMTNKSALFCILAYSISFGVSGHWIGVVAINFEPLGISESDCGVMGLVLVFTSTVASIVLSRYMDYFRSKMKLALMVVLTMSLLCLIWLTMTIDEVIPFTATQVWVSTIIGISMVCATRSLFFEFTAQVARPAPEGLVGALLNAGFNLVGVIFLSLYFLEDYGIGFSWINYALVISIFMSIPIVGLAKQPSEYICIQ